MVADGSLCMIEVVALYRANEAYQWACYIYAGNCANIPERFAQCL